MDGDAEHKAWAALALEAADFYIRYGGVDMSVSSRQRYEELIAQVQRLALLHNVARDAEVPSGGDEAG